MKFLLTVAFFLTLECSTGQVSSKKLAGKFVDADIDYKASITLDINPDNTFYYVFHHSVGSCYAKGTWKNSQDTIVLNRKNIKNHVDSFEVYIFPNFIDKDKWFFKNDTLYLLDHAILTKVKLVRS